MDVLGVVGKTYNPIQNAEAFSFLDPLVRDSDIEYHTAGALGRGEVVWILLKKNGPMLVDGDEIENYLLLRTSHNGSTALEAMMTPVRVVCQNTLNFALDSVSGGQFRVKHTNTAQVEMEQASKVLNKASEYFQSLQETFEQFLDAPFSMDEMERVAEMLFPPGRDGERSTQALNSISVMKDLFEDGTGVTGSIRGTKYAGVQAVTEFADHHKTFRSSSRYDESEARFRSIVDGSAKKFKQKGFEMIAEA